MTYAIFCVFLMACNGEEVGSVTEHGEADHVSEVEHFWDLFISFKRFQLKFTAYLKIVRAKCVPLGF